MTRRGFILGALAAATSTKLGRWVSKPLPPPPPAPVEEFRRVIVPMCFYSHPRRTVIIDNLLDPAPDEKIRALVDSINFERA